MTTILQSQPCLACGHVMDRHAHMSTPDDPIATPAPGDITLCIRCGFIMMYDDELKFRTLTKEEMVEVLQDTRVQAAIIAIAELDKKRKQ